MIGLNWLRRFFANAAVPAEPRLPEFTGVTHDIDAGALHVSWSPWPTGLYAEGKSLNVGDDLLVPCESGAVRRFRVVECRCTAGPMSDLLYGPGCKYGPRAFSAKVQCLEAKGD